MGNYNVPSHLQDLWDTRSHSFTMPHDMYMGILQDKWNENFISSQPKKSPVRILAKSLYEQIKELTIQLQSQQVRAAEAETALEQLKLNILKNPDKVFKELAVELAEKQKEDEEYDCDD